jgi:predicted RNase H-like HicB family nuclease
MNEPRYTVVIQWSEEDQVYVVSLPEWGGCQTHGSTYEEAARHAQEVLELLIENHEATKEGPLPEPKLFHFPGVEAADLEKPGTTPVDAAGAGLVR